jgi:phosphonate transport system permease protein
VRPEPHLESRLPLAQLIEPAVSATLASPESAASITLGRAVDSEIECAIKRNRHGLIRVRTLSKPNIILIVAVVVLAALSAYTMLTLNYGKTPFFEALGQAVNDFWRMMTEPFLGRHFTLGEVLEGLFVSLALAILTTVISALVAFVLGLCAAANLSNRLVSNVIKAFMSLFRAVPTILWVLVFTVAIGLGPEAAVCGLLFHGVAYLVKAYSESFEEVDPGVIEALRASGTSWWQVVFQAVVPEKISEMLSWTFIRFEINFVNAVAVGAVAGAGGVGYQLFLAGSFYHNIHEVGFITYLCLIVAAILEVAATRLRGRYIA